MKGIILIAGKATRLRPCTKVTSKGLLPIYNRPLIYYPLNTLIKAGIKEILLIIAPDHAGHYLNLLGSGAQWGVQITYEIQEIPRGTADAFILGASFIGHDDVAMIFGDNIFVDDLSEEIKNFKKGAKIFAKPVADPERFGIVEIDDKGKAISIEEKPKEPKSNLCITGVYAFDHRVVEIAKNIQPSARGELEITDIINWYLAKGELEVGMIKEEWIDAGTFDSLLEAQIIAKEKMQTKMII
jgi:glucose-1-phosphate thymidylyltransferase